MKKFIYGVVIVAALLFLYMYPTKGFEASSSGLLLWFNTLVPTLLPLMILSNLIIRTGLVEILMSLFTAILHRLLGLSSYGCYAMFIGFFCGYPMGAKVISDLTRQELLSLSEAQYLIGFCNNVSPMFVINFLVIQHLHNASLITPTLLIIYGAPLLYGILTNHFHRHKFVDNQIVKPKEVPTTMINFELVDACIMDGMRNITKLGGYIILFAILSNMILTIPITNTLLKSVLVGLTEVTNGIHILSDIQIHFSIKYTLLILACSFGGLCALAQTESMIHSSGIRLSGYIRSKLIITAIAVILSVCFIHL